MGGSTELESFHNLDSFKTHLFLYLHLLFFILDLTHYFSSSFLDLARSLVVGGKEE